MSFSVVPFDSLSDRLIAMDFTAANHELTDEVINDMSLFSHYVEHSLSISHARYGIGGYNEHRTVYSRSSVFDDTLEPRRLHLGLDIWGKSGTPVFAIADGIVHSFAFNNRSGDYGATIIVKHEIEGSILHSLYGHLSLKDLQGLRVDEHISKGQLIAHFGEPSENGNWPPHLHLQLIKDMGIWEGDYPGVCKFSEREQWLLNSPDPLPYTGLKSSEFPLHLPYGE
ncbi:MAG: peptidoglycan DD-metalloendopeptidase family protein [Sphingobacteriales bacterium]|jgi:murein DD-endopeptidase MepM/ murein hydrolase activator NlpD